ncbi:hypothetical protein A2U01_0031876, partial [Trifolium medium]|nr:hypothetical protein [Trifolium medium]
MCSHVSQLRKYISDPSHVITPNDIQLKENLSFEVPPVKIANGKMKRLRTKEIPLVKVICEATGDATWELESKMKEQYPEFWYWRNAPWFSVFWVFFWFMRNARGWLAQHAAGVGVVLFSSGSCVARRVVLLNAQA